MITRTSRGSTRGRCYAKGCWRRCSGVRGNAFCLSSLMHLDFLEHHHWFRGWQLKPEGQFHTPCHSALHSFWISSGKLCSAFWVVSVLFCVYQEQPLRCVLRHCHLANEEEHTPFFGALERNQCCHDLVLYYTICVYIYLYTICFHPTEYIVTGIREPMDP